MIAAVEDVKGFREAARADAGGGPGRGGDGVGGEQGARGGVWRGVEEAAEFGRASEESVEVCHRAAVVGGDGGGPCCAGRADAVAAAGDPERGQLHRTTDQPPGGEGDVEGGELRAAGVDLQAVEDFAEDDAHGGFVVEFFFLAQHGHEEVQQRDEEMARTRARVEDPQCAHRLRPAGKRARGRGAVVAAAQGGEGNRRGGVFGRPPRAEGVVEQEIHHVRLGEKLRDGGQRGGVEPVAGTVNGGFFVRAPELVDPAEGIVGEEDFVGQRGSERAEFGGAGATRKRVAGREDVREQARGTGGEETVDGEKAREEEPVPMRRGVGGFGEAARADDGLREAAAEVGGQPAHMATGTLSRARAEAPAPRPARFNPAPPV